MPNYEEIIEQSNANVKSLSEKLKELDQLHQDIKELIKQPEMFDAKFQEIVKLSVDYTKILGAATKKYLDGNNILFTTKLNELLSIAEDLKNKIGELKKQIIRLEKIDLETHFNKFQKTLLNQNETLKKEIKNTKILQVIGLVLTIIILIVLISKL